MRFARYVRLYTDNFGDTHFEDLEVPLASQEFSPATPPLNLAQFLPVSGTVWIGAPGDWGGDVPHTAPQRQIFCTVEGEYEVTASDGEVRCFPAGSILLIEDTTGKGHQTSITYDRGALILAINIAEEIDGSLVV